MLRPVAFCLAILLLLAATPCAAAQPVEGFVQRAGTKLVIPKDDGTCEPFNFVGTNVYYLAVRAASNASRCEVVEVLDKAQELGLTVIRTWAFNEGPSRWHAFQRAPNSYDERVLEGLDFAVAEASKRGIRLLLALANYWQHYGGVDEYNRWSFAAGHGTCDGELACRDDFWADPYARRLYQNHVRTILLRRNTITGRLYRDEPGILGYNLMNEPRSTADLYTVTRQSVDTGLEYNITYNSGDSLQDWIETQAAYVKSIDKAHLLTVGSESFFGPSTPLYLYANPGPWAALEGVDFVRNHAVPGIDFATMHVYVDQWLCTQRGSTRDGQLGFFRNWIDAHQQAAEEELQMPVVLEEFGGKIDKRKELYEAAFQSCRESAERPGGSCAGVLFWILYHSDYRPLDAFGGGYGVYEPPVDDAHAEVRELVVRHAADLRRINAEGAGAGACTWSAPRPLGEGCANVETSISLGGLPWQCLPGEPEDIDSCATIGKSSRLYRNPPDAWRGKAAGKELPFNTIEILVSGELVRNSGTEAVNLQGASVVVPFSRGLHTRYEGEWIRSLDPNGDLQTFCWHATVYDAKGRFVFPYHGNLCETGKLELSFTRHEWPLGTKADRGLNISFPDELWLRPGESIQAGTRGRDVLFSFKDRDAEGQEAGGPPTEEINPLGTARRLDVSSLEDDGAVSCPLDPAPQAAPPPPPPPCPHPNRACPRPLQTWAVPVPAADIEPALLPADEADLYVTAPPTPVSIAPNTLVHVSAEVRVAGGITGNVALGDSKTYVDDDALFEDKVEGDVVDPSLAPNPEERRTRRVKLGSDVGLTIRYRHGDGYAFVSVARGEAPAGRWMRLAGLVELESAGELDDVVLLAEVFGSPNVTAVEVRDVRVSDPRDVPATQEYQPCQLDPATAPDAVIRLAPNETHVLHASLCSVGYAQTLRVLGPDGAELAATRQGCGYSDVTLEVTLEAGKEYTLAVDAEHGFPYGSFRGGAGVLLTRPDGEAVGGFHAKADPAAWNRFVRVEGTRFMLGCEQWSFVGTNVWDLMDTARYPSFRGKVNERLDLLRDRGLTVARTWGFSLGTGETADRRAQRLQLRPGVYDDAVFEGLDYVLAEAAKRGIKLIIALEDYWLSVDRYVRWSPTAGGKTDFFTDWNARQMYKDHLRYFVSRRNAFTGVRYADDDTILAWNLLNEPRCTGCGWALQAWVEEMSQYLKAITNNQQLVTIGEEGLYSSTCERVYFNPGAGKRRTGIASSPWALQEGQDFVANHKPESIDFATTHIWPDNWLGFADYSLVFSNEAFDYTFGSQVWREKLHFVKDWVAVHIEDAQQRLRKPILVEEFGKAVPAQKLMRNGALLPGESVHDGLEVRNEIFSAVYDLVERNNQTAPGSAFWVLYRNGQGSDDPYRVTTRDQSTFDIVEAHARKMQSLHEYGGCAA